MIDVMISWVVMLVSCILISAGITQVGQKIFKIDSRFLKTYDSIIVTGIVALTVYAEIISLCHKVGRLAWAGIFLLEIICIVFLFLQQKKAKSSFKLPMISTWKWIAIIILSIMITGWTSAAPLHYDTSLYHAQAIRWIE